MMPVMTPVAGSRHRQPALAGAGEQPHVQVIRADRDTRTPTDQRGEVVRVHVHALRGQPMACFMAHDDEVGAGDDRQAAAWCLRTSAATDGRHAR